MGNSQGTYLGSNIPQENIWDFAKQPDVVVINLGTNDSSYVKSDSAKKEEYTAAYVAFLKQVREKNPDAVIFATLGIMGADLYSCIEDAVECYVTETGDNKVHTMKFDTQSAEDGIAADWHPSEKTHEKAAEKLSGKIKEVMDW
jgi:predicted Fe-Mo cluster-binding NifX family protein